MGNKNSGNNYPHSNKDNNSGNQTKYNTPVYYKNMFDTIIRMEILSK